MKNSNLIKKVILLIILMTTVPPFLLTAQERVLNGLTISKNTVWRGTIRLKGDVVIKKNAKLIVESGTKILFEANTDLTKAGKDKTKSEIIVEGILDVRGDLNNKVIFTSSADNPRMGDWYGITIINPSVASIIEYAVIEYAYNGISTKRSHPRIRKSQIRYNYNAGILLEVKSNPKIVENIISENGYAGIICKLGSKPALTGNLIALNQIGVVIFSMSKPNFGNLNKGQSYNIGMNDIHDNQEFNIYNHSSEQIFAENNSWGSTSLNKIKKKNYDRNQNNKYGAVKIEPLLQTEQNKEKLMALAQQTPATSSQSGGKSTPANLAAAPASVKNNINNKKQPVTQKRSAANLSASVNNKTEPSLKAAENSVNNTKIAKTGTMASVKKEVKPAVVIPVKEEVKPAAPIIDYNQVFLEPFLDQKKRKIEKSVIPDLSGLISKLKVSGHIIVRVVVDKNGNVESAKVMRGINEFYDSKCLEAAKKFKFKKGTVKGVPVRFSTNIFFKFK